MHERLIHAAGHDPLTALANRGLFEDRLQRVLARVRRYPARFAILYIDLDKFKEINDLYGHFSGDHVLINVAARLKDCVRDSDTVARMGGDEFVLLLDRIIKPSDAQTVAQKIRNALDSPIVHEKKHFYITPSIGISIYPDHGDNMESLLHYADNAMYSSKKAAR
jgi:diguanylate cyclase (GGDEF)-like protein